MSVLIDKDLPRSQGFSPFRCGWCAILDELDRLTQAPTVMVCDAGHEKKMRQLMGGHGAPNLGCIDPTPLFETSNLSHRIQAADLTATLMYQQEQPNAEVRRREGHKIFETLGPICPFARAGNPPRIITA